MAASVLLACGLSEQKLPPFVHISEESGVDGSFLISSILCQRLRISNAGTLLVCLQHNYQHYFNAGMRLGYNCSLFLGRTLGAIDIVDDLSKDFASCKWLSSERKLCDLLLDDLKAQLSSGNFNARINNTIIIDNLSILYNLGVSRQDIQQFYHGLVALTKQQQNLTIITKMSNCDLYGPDDSNVSKYGSIHIRVIKLKSGIFREVDGKLLIKRLEEEHEDDGYEQNYTTKELLYKVNDRNVKIFNPGQVGLKA